MLSLGRQQWNGQPLLERFFSFFLETEKIVTKCDVVISTLLLFFLSTTLININHRQAHWTFYARPQKKFPLTKVFRKEVYVLNYSIWTKNETAGRIRQLQLKYLSCSSRKHANIDMLMDLGMKTVISFPWGKKPFPIMQKERMNLHNALGVVKKTEQLALFSKPGRECPFLQNDVFFFGTQTSQKHQGRVKRR